MNSSEAEAQQWHDFEEALKSIDAQVGNLRAMLARLRETQCEGRHQAHVHSSSCSCYCEETWVSM